MADQAKPSAESRDFGGMATSLDAEDLAAGAAEVQLNLASVVAGQLTTRRGYLVVNFEAE